MEKHVNNLLGILQQSPADPFPQWQHKFFSRVRSLIEDMSYGSPPSDWKSQLEGFVDEINGFKEHPSPALNEDYINKVAHGIGLILIEP